MLFHYGFRIFFALAGLVAVVVMTLWGLGLAGMPMLAAVGPYWHGHEMVFGFAGALVAGFVLTAVPNWTRSTRVHGWPLMVMAALFVCGRVASFVPGVAGLILHGLGLLFLPLVALAIGVPIVKSNNQRNYGVVVLVALLAVAAAVSVAARLGYINMAPALPARTAAFVLIILIAVVGGRITPFFTRNATKASVRSRGAIDNLALMSLVVAAVMAAVDVEPSVTALALLLAAALNAARMRGWGTLAAARNPLLLILHVGYAWIVAGLSLGALSVIWPHLVTTTTALHALTAGALGAYAIGMMARVSLGHTGRPLKISSLITLSFLSMSLAALFRVLGPLLVPRWSSVFFVLAAMLFALSYLGFMVVYTPMLMAPRPDGKAG